MTKKAKPKAEPLQKILLKSNHSMLEQRLKEFSDPVRCYGRQKVRFSPYKRWLYEYDDKIVIVENEAWIIKRGNKVFYRPTMPKAQISIGFTKTGKFIVRTFMKSGIRTTTYNGLGSSYLAPPEVLEALVRLFSRYKGPEMAHKLATGFPTMTWSYRMGFVHKVLVEQQIKDVGVPEGYLNRRPLTLQLLYSLSHIGARKTAKKFFGSKSKGVVRAMTDAMRMPGYEEALQTAYWYKKCLLPNDTIRVLRENKACSLLNVVVNFRITRHTAMRVIEFCGITPRQFTAWLLSEHNIQGILEDTINMFLVMRREDPDLMRDVVIPNNLREAHTMVVHLHNLYMEHTSLKKNKRLEEWIPVADFSLHGMTKGEYTYVLPENYKQLIQWGQDMHHCIATYADRFVRRNSLLVGILKDGEMIANAEVIRDEFVHKGYDIRQLYGKYNKEVKSDECHRKVILRHCSDFFEKTE